MKKKNDFSIFIAFLFFIFFNFIGIAQGLL